LKRRLEVIMPKKRAPCRDKPVYQWTIADREKVAAWELGLCEDGIIFLKSPVGVWRTWKRLKPGVSPQQYARKIKRIIATQDPKEANQLYLSGLKIPSLRQLEKWLSDGICGTPDGYIVEPDGYSPNDWPSWLIIVGYFGEREKVRDARRGWGKANTRSYPLPRYIRKGGSDANA
jgi:hypothetical protein